MTRTVRRTRAGRSLRALLAALALGVVVATFIPGGRAAAAPPSLEINGREFFGTLFVEDGQVYAPLDVVGPLLVGCDFTIDNYDVVLRRVSFHYTPAGASAPVRGSLPGCMKRGAALYGPLRVLLAQFGGSWAETARGIAVAYPPVAVMASPPPSPSVPTEWATTPASPVTPTTVSDPAPATVPAEPPALSPVPASSSPPAVQVSPSPAPTAPTTGQTLPSPAPASPGPAPASTSPAVAQVSPSPAPASPAAAQTSPPRAPASPAPVPSQAAEPPVAPPVSPIPVASATPPSSVPPPASTTAQSPIIPPPVETAVVPAVPVTPPPTSSPNPVPTPTVPSVSLAPPPSPSASESPAPPTPSPESATPPALVAISVPRVTAPPEVPLTPEMAVQEARMANQAAFNGHTICRIDIYHPVSPDPSDAIPRTDLAGARVFVPGLSAADQVWVSLWSGRDPLGLPAFTRRMRGFRGQDLAEGCFFVRLPLPLEAGWHVLRVDLNHRERVDYRFVTY